MRLNVSSLLAPLLLSGLLLATPSPASDHHHDGGHGGGIDFVPPETHVDYVPVKRTRMEEVWQEYYVEDTDHAVYKMGPRKHVDIASIHVVPDNFIKVASTGQWSEGISLSGEIVQTVEYDADVGVDPNNKFDPIAIQTQILSSDKKRKSSVMEQPLDPATARVEKRVDPSNPKRIIETRTFFLGRMAPLFIPYSSLRSVLFVGPRGTLMRIILVQVAVVGPGGVVLVGPNGPIIFVQRISIGSFTLPTWLPPGAPWPVFNPGVFIPTLPIPMPWLFGGRVRPPGYVTWGPVRGGPARPGVPIGGPPPGGIAGGGPRPGTPIGGPGGQAPGQGTVGAGAGSGPRPGTPIGGPGGGGAPAGQGSGNAVPPGQPGGQPPSTGQPPQPGTPVGGPGAQQPGPGNAAGTGIAAATGRIASVTLQVTVPSKKYLTYWFTLPEQGGNYHEVTLKLTNYSIGIGLANLAAIPASQAREYQKARKRIQDLPNIGVNLETGVKKELKTLDLAEQVNAYPPPERMYILVLASPTVDENLIEIEGIPDWAIPMVFEKEDGPKKFKPDVDVVAVNQ